MRRRNARTPRRRDEDVDNRQRHASGAGTTIVVLALCSFVHVGCAEDDVSDRADNASGEGTAEFSIAEREQTCAGQCMFRAICPVDGFAIHERDCFADCMEQFALIEAEQPACFGAFVDFMVCLAGYTTCAEWTDFLTGDAEPGTYSCAAEELLFFDC